MYCNQPNYCSISTPLPHFPMLHHNSRKTSSPEPPNQMLPCEEDDKPKYSLQANPSPRPSNLPIFVQQLYQKSSALLWLPNQGPTPMEHSNPLKPFPGHKPEHNKNVNTNSKKHDSPGLPPLLVLYQHLTPPSLGEFPVIPDCTCK